MRNIGALSFSILAGTMLFGAACTVTTTDSSGGSGGSNNEGAGAGTSVGPVGAGGAAGTSVSTTGGSGGTAGTGGTATAGAAGTTAAGAGGVATAGNGGATTAGTGGVATAGAGGASTAGAAGSGGDAGSGGVTSAGAGGVSSAGAGGTGGAIGIGGNTGGDCQVRFAMMGCDVPDFVDVCFQPQGSTTWFGPIFNQNGDPHGFYYPGVSIYTQFDPGTYTVRLVPADAPDCTAVYNNAADGSVTVTQGGNYTLVLEGTLAGQTSGSTAKPLQWFTYEDDATPTGGELNFQTINALADYTGQATISFCTQVYVDDSISTVVSDVPPLSPTSSLGMAPASDTSMGMNNWFADMFLLDSLHQTIAISDFQVFNPDQHIYAIVSGTSPDATGPTDAPFLTTCTHDPANRGDIPNGHPLAAFTDKETGCYYFQQTKPSNHPLATAHFQNEDGLGDHSPRPFCICADSRSAFANRASFTSSSPARPSPKVPAHPLHSRRRSHQSSEALRSPRSMC